MEDHEPYNVVPREELVARRAAVARRLDDGYHRIDQALVSGEDITAWEDFWIELLSQYETLSDEVERAA